MNKKFSTLLASVLLAGSLFSVNAQTNVGALSSVADNGVYYALKFHENATSTQPAWGSSWNMVVETSTLAAATLTLEQEMNEPKIAAAEWTVKAVNVNGAVAGYSLVNGEGVKLSFDLTKDASGNITGGSFAPKGDGEVYIFKFKKQSGIRYMYATIHNVDLYIKQSGNDLVLDLVNTTGAGLFSLPTHTYTATELNKIVNGGFGLQICYQDANNNDAVVEYSSISGNPFTGILTAVSGTNGVKLYNENNKQIVLTTDKWGSLGGGTTQTGYKFATVTTGEKATLVANGKLYAEEFQITSPSLAGTEPLEVLALNSMDGDLELVVTTIEGVNRLTAAVDNAGNKKADYTKDNTTADHNTWVRFGLSDQVDYADFYDKLWNITSGSYAAAPTCNTNTDWVPAAQVELSVPEGQWLYIGDQTFQNRESGKTLRLAGLRYVDGEDNVYAYNDAPNDDKTVTIAEAGKPGNTEAGYFAAYSANELKTKAFNIGTVIASTGDTVYMTNTGSKIAWTKEVADAIQFRFTKVIFGSTPKTDVIKHYTEYLGLDKNDELTTKIDTINFYRYNLTEAASGLRLAYNETNKVYQLVTPVEDEDYESLDQYSDEYTTVVLKSKGAENYNILTGILGNALVSLSKGNALEEVNATAGAAQWETALHAFCNSEKLYGAHNSNSLVQADAAYNYVENDIFVIKDADNYMYRAVTALDTIKIFRDKDNYYTLYEQGELLKVGDEVKEGFLGLEHFLDPTFAEKNAALLVDTAAGYGTWRPEYLLAVDAEIEADGWTCPFNAEHNTSAWREENGGHCADAVKDRPFITGRYLVNLVDSAANRTDCYYQELSGIKYYRLGFVQATHIGDSLIIASTNDTISLLDNTVDKVCTFAFRYTDAERRAFRIETAYNYSVDEDGDVDFERGWIKYHNGIPVVTNNVSDAEIFDLEVLEGVTPTANDEVSVSEVSVVATNGAVIVKGAAGKKVAISNILGQTVANTVITSDNATIAAPAGIVVVAVEGEEAVKVVVK